MSIVPNSGSLSWEWIEQHSVEELREKISSEETTFDNLQSEFAGKNFSHLSPKTINLLYKVGRAAPVEKINEIYKSVVGNEYKHLILPKMLDLFIKGNDEGRALKILKKLELYYCPEKNFIWAVHFKMGRLASKILNPFPEAFLEHLYQFDKIQSISSDFLEPLLSNLVAYLNKKVSQRKLDNIRDTLGHVLWFACFKKLWNLAETILAAHQNINLDRYSTVWITAANQEWGLLDKMLDSDEYVNTSFFVKKGMNRGKTALWMAAEDDEWSLVEKMLAKDPYADINAFPDNSRGASVLWLAASKRQWKIVEIMLDRPLADVNAFLDTDSYRGCSVLWYVATEHQWDLVEKILDKFPNADVNSSPEDEEGKDAVYLLAPKDPFL